jgi:hypothetical protein
MNRLALGLIASIILLPVISFAQSAPQPPAAWVAFQKEESAKRAAFNAQMSADMKAFMEANPEMKTYFDQMRAAAQARMAAWRAQHHKP